jgi:glycosyltransferase A (GT-A) superfamily protein (DUF2064 family)
MKELLIIFQHSDSFQESLFQEKESHVLSRIKNLDKDVYIFFDKYIPVRFLKDQENIKCFRLLGEDDGEKMMNSFLKGFINKYSNILLVNGLCSHLSSELIGDAFKKLITHDFVVGPLGTDEFYLIGMKKLCPFIFEQKECLLSSTINCWNEIGSTYSMLEVKEVPVYKN